MNIRLYQRKDLDIIIDLFYHCVHTVNSQDYSEEELEAMAPKVVDRYHWQASLERNHTLVAEIDDKVVGFGNIGQTGFLDRLFVDPDYLRQGIATKLVERLENYARAQDNLVIDTVATITSIPFFEKQGYKIIEEQITERRGVRLVRYLMEKTI